MKNIKLLSLLLFLGIVGGTLSGCVVEDDFVYRRGWGWHRW